MVVLIAPKMVLSQNTDEEAKSQRIPRDQLSDWKVGVTGFEMQSAVVSRYGIF